MFYLQDFQRIINFMTGRLEFCHVSPLLVSNIYVAYGILSKVKREDRTLFPEIEFNSFPRVFPEKEPFT